MHRQNTTNVTSQSEWQSRWTVATSELSKISYDAPGKREFISKVLEYLHSHLDCERVTFLQCAPDEDEGHSWLVKGQSYPIGKKFEERDSRECSIFDEDILLPEGRNERYIHRTIQRDGRECHGSVLQIQMNESGYAYSLSLTFPSHSDLAPPLLEEDDAARTFLALFIHVKHSKEGDLVRHQRKQRRLLIDRVMSCSGDLKTIAGEVCCAWKDMFDAPGVRLWVVNRYFNELKLAHMCCDPQYTEFLSRGANTLSNESDAMIGVETGAVVRLDSLTEVDSNRPPTPDSLEGYRVIRVPLISSDSIPDENEPRLKGLIDIIVADDKKWGQPDDRLLFVASVSAAALLRARSLDRVTVTNEVNAAAVDLVNPLDRSHLNKRKDDFLGEVVRIVKKALNVNCCSIFEADEKRTALRCVATTGIEGHGDYKNTVVYRDNDGITWSAFSSGLDINLKDVQNSALNSGIRGFRESRSLASEPGLDPFLAVPLPGTDANSATGVIRLCERMCDFDPTRHQTFSRHDMEVLTQIAADVSPILQMIRIQAHRELYIERTMHQLIQPLQGVIGYVSNIIDGVYATVESREEKLRYVRQMALALEGMVRSGAWLTESMDFSKVESAPRKERKVTRYFIDRIIDMQPLRRDSDNIRIALLKEELVDRLGDFWVDDVFFDQAFQNVLYNAVKYSYPDTTIHVQITRSRDELWVYIRSIGLPVAEGEERRIFWDRERGDMASHYDIIGTGQGLFMTRRIMRGLGGDIEFAGSEPIESVKSPEGFPAAHRTTFVLKYPGAFR